MKKINGHAPNVRPFLKWAGNKFRVIERIRPMLPPGKRLVEPFAGSAAVFLNTDYRRYLICDSNADLINLYQTIKTRRADFIEAAAALFDPGKNRSDIYYDYREEFNDTEDPFRKALLFLYLNRHGYNGLCRYNSKGLYNVPFGRYNKPYFPRRELEWFAKKAQRASFKKLDFATVLKQARAGDVIYCDPPYVPLTASANFTSYSAGGFSLEDQQRLADLADATRRRGIPVLISNHNTDFTRQAYRAASDIKRFTVQRYISCNGHKRQHAGELLALFS